MTTLLSVENLSKVFTLGGGLFGSLLGLAFVLQLTRPLLLRCRGLKRHVLTLDVAPTFAAVLEREQPHVLVRQ